MHFVALFQMLFSNSSIVRVILATGWILETQCLGTYQSLSELELYKTRVAGNPSRGLSSAFPMDGMTARHWFCRNGSPLLDFRWYEEHCPLRQATLIRYRNLISYLKSLNGAPRTRVSLKWIEWRMLWSRESVHYTGAKVRLLCRRTPLTVRQLLKQESILKPSGSPLAVIVGVLFREYSICGFPRSWFASLSSYNKMDGWNF
jgi:hypothetical protein